MSPVGPMVLVLDGDQRSALAATRSLGRQGIAVGVGAVDRCSLAGVSKFARSRWQYPSPEERPGEFLGAVDHYIRRNGIRWVFPMTEVTLERLLHRSAPESVRKKVPFGPLEAFGKLSDKYQVLRLAKEQGIAVPKSRLIGSDRNDRRIAEAVAQVGGYPVVLKPCRSRIWQGTRCIHGKVRYAENPGQLRSLIERDAGLAFPFLVQEVVEGFGAGVFLLSDGQRIRAAFAHRRLRERPPSGGVSVLSESVEPDHTLQVAAGRLLNAAGWYGPAMVEFKVDESGRAVLMEVNARFWGSLQLAVDAGVDFPHLLFKLAEGELKEDVQVYRFGVRNRWLLGDVDNLYLTLKENRDPSVWIGGLARFLGAFFDRRARSEVFRFSDIRPGLCEWLHYWGWRGHGA